MERVKWNLELEHVDNQAFSALAAELDATRGELNSALQTLAAQRELIDRLVGHLGLDHAGASQLASPATLERLLALSDWLAKQPATDLRISVIIPTRSRPTLLSEAISSVRAQSHPNWELIVVDDGSEDETREVLAAIDDDRVRSVRTEGVGSCAARNAGLESATGEAIAYLDDDNLMLPEWLAAVAWAFSRLDDVDVVYGARVIEDETPLGSEGRLPRLVLRSFDRDQLLEANYIDASVIAHRAGLPQGHWDPEFLGDWDLMIRLTEHKPALALPVVAALYRTGAPGRQTYTAGARGPAEGGARAAQRRLEARLAAAALTADVDAESR